MSKHFSRILFGLLFLLLSQTETAQAGFYIRRMHSDSATNTENTHATALSLITKPSQLLKATGFAVPMAAKRSHDQPFYAWFSIGCGVIGLALMAILQATPLIILFGLLAGFSGKAGIKKNKHNSFLKTLCYIGIAVGLILVIFGTIPLLFLV